VTVTETNHHAIVVPPDVMTLGGGPVYLATRDIVAEVEFSADPNMVADVEISADPVEIYPLLSASPHEMIQNPEIPQVIIFDEMSRRFPLI